MQDQLKIDTTDNLPYPIEKRKRTDKFCIYINTIFVVLLFIIFLFTLNVENLKKMTYPNDADGKLCGFDVKEFPYLYYTSLRDPTKRLCVSKCPSAGDTRIDCNPTKGLSCQQNDNPKYEVQIYDSELLHNRAGLFCVPKDKAQKEHLLKTANVFEKYNFFAFYDAMWRSIWISILFGLVSFVLLHFFPYRMVPFTIAVGGICFVAFALVIIAFSTGYFLVKFILFAFCGLMGFMCLWTLWVDDRRESVFVCSALIHAASLVHGNKTETNTHAEGFSIIFGFLSLLKPLAIIGVFFLLFMGFLVLIGFQILSAWSCGKMVFDPNYPFYEIVGFGSVFLQILIFIQFLWGLSFLKESFNFIVSGYAAQWYFKGQGSYKNSIELLLCRTWGSVVGASFLLGFLYFVDLIVDFFFPQDVGKAKRDPNKDSINQDRQISENGNCLGVFSLLRSESMAYMSLVNFPYCNSSRYCEYLACESGFYNYSQTTNRVFRLCQHIIPIFLTVLIAIITMRSSSGNASPYAILFIIIISFFTTTYLHAYHGDGAEGILVSTFLEELLDENDPLVKAPEVVQKFYETDYKDTFKGKSISDVLFMSTEQRKQTAGL